MKLKSLASIVKKMSVATAVVAGVALMAAVPQGQASAAVNSNVKEAQRILTKFSIPAGPIDGRWGSQTARGLCAFRSIAGLPGGRAALNSSDSQSLAAYDAAYASLNSISAPKNGTASTYLVANKTCQTLTYVENAKYARVMPISTGKAGYDTANGNYVLGFTQKGWSCSSLYPESCVTQTAGRFASKSNYGNMYNKRSVYGGVFVHGSTSVPAFPASHGCIRVTPGDSDWMYDHVNRVPISVVGAY